MKCELFSNYLSTLISYKTSSRWCTNGQPIPCQYDFFHETLITDFFCIFLCDFVSEQQPSYGRKIYQSCSWHTPDNVLRVWAIFKKIEILVIFDNFLCSPDTLFTDWVTTSHLVILGDEILGNFELFIGCIDVLNHWIDYILKFRLMKCKISIFWFSPDFCWICKSFLGILVNRCWLNVAQICCILLKIENWVKNIFTSPFYLKKWRSYSLMTFVHPQTAKGSSDR